MIFTQAEEAQILATIRSAEARTSGEIRLFVEDFCLRDHPLERAEELFQLFGMYNTRERNGVLLYLAEKSRHFAIWGDVAIHQAVGDTFWEAEKRLLREHLQHGTAAEGVCVAIQEIGARLQQHFPATETEPNDNELPDEILYG